jgi:hypothetical protein
MKSDQTKKRIKIKDKRLFRPAVFIEDSGQGKKQMMAIFHQITTLIIDRCKIDFPSPNPISFFMSISKKQHDIARVIYQDLIKPNIISDQVYDVPDEDLPRLLDYFEHIQTSVITIYSAVEALSNVAIPKDFELVRKNPKGVKEIWEKETIERWFSTSEKIGDILPGILKIPSPKNLPFWEGFKKLESVRNDIIHQKYSDKNKKDIETRFLEVLISEKINEYIKNGFDLIAYFCENDRSHLFLPLLFNGPSEDYITINDWDGTFTWPDQNT